MVGCGEKTKPIKANRRALAGNPKHETRNPEKEERIRNDSPDILVIYFTFPAGSDNIHIESTEKDSHQR